MNRASSHDQDERRREVKRKQKVNRRARNVMRKTVEARERAKEAAAIDLKLRGLRQFAGCRSADEYAAVLQAKRGLL